MNVGDLIQGIDQIVGLKAVHGPMRSHILCVGARGSPHEPRYFSVARSAVERAVGRPWVIVIGAGAGVRDDLGGRVVNVARLSYDYGLTSDLASRDEAARLAQWPVAIVANEVWRLDNHPHLVADLGLPDRTIMAGAQDGIIRPADKLEVLWQRLRDWPVQQEELPLPANFLPSDRPRRVQSRSSRRPVTAQSEEGQRLWTVQLRIESSGGVKNAAKRRNAERNGGRYTCEACTYSSADPAMLDAHHPIPLAAGVRTTLAAHLQVLCPTCHRRAHRGTGDRLQPESLADLRDWVSAGRP